MPDWLRVFADNQPVTVVVNASRFLNQGDTGLCDLSYAGNYNLFARHHPAC